MDKQALTQINARTQILKLRKKDLFIKSLITTDFADIFITRIGHTNNDPYHFWNTDYRSDYCLQYIVSGKGEFFVNESLHLLKKNDLFLVPRKRAHYYRANKNDPYDLYYIHFNGKGVLRFLDYIGLSEDNPIISIENEKLIDIFNELIDISNNYKQSDQLLLLSKGYSLLYEISKKAHKAEIDFKSHNQSIIDTVYDYIAEHFMQKVTLNDLASLVHLNKNYLCQLFHKETGSSPIQYLIQYRINRACILLQYDYTLTEIAYMCGFNDASDFSNCFKRLIGIPPRAYRQDANSSSPNNHPKPINLQERMES